MGRTDRARSPIALRRSGLFGRAYLQLTERAAALLGYFRTPAHATSAKRPVANLCRGSRLQAPDRSMLSFTDPSAKLADGGIYKDLSPTPFQKRQPGQVPEDLQRLRSLGFIDFLIFKLMREARENGKRLSDVVEATWDHLKAAKAPINYCAPSFEARSTSVISCVAKSVGSGRRTKPLDRASSCRTSRSAERRTDFHRRTGSAQVRGRCGRSVDDVYAVDEGVGTASRRMEGEVC